MELGATPVNSQARGFLSKNKKALKKKPKKKTAGKKRHQLDIFEKQALARERAKKREKNKGSHLSDD